MTDFEFEILDTIHTSPGQYIDVTDLRNRFVGRISDADALVKYLLVQKWIEFIPSSNSVKLSCEGVRAFISEKESRENHTQEAATKDADKRADAVKAAINKKQHFRHDFIVAIVSSVSGSLATLLAEHLPELIDWICAFLFP